MVHVLVDPVVNNGADFAPAFITRAFSETCVNVRVLLDAPDKTPALNSVPLFEDRAAADAWCAKRRDELHAEGYGDPIHLSVAYWSEAEALVYYDLPESPSVRAAGRTGHTYGCMCRACDAVRSERAADETSDVDLAHVAYAAYGESTDFKNFRGEPMPAWEDLGPTIQAAWIAAVAAVAAAVTPDNA